MKNAFFTGFGRYRVNPTTVLIRSDSQGVLARATFDVF